MTFATLYYLCQDIVPVFQDFVNSAIDFFTSSVDLSAVGLGSDVPVLGLLAAGFFSTIIVRIVFSLAG